MQTLLGTLRTGAPERFVVRENDMTATLADLPAILQHLHGPGASVKAAIGTARVVCTTDGSVLEFVSVT